MLRVLEFFFFQAEDGIRDIGVTGVQTCALPISTYYLTGFCRCGECGGSFSGGYRSAHIDGSVHYGYECRKRRAKENNCKNKPVFKEVLEPRSEEHTSELQSRQYLVCRLLLENNKLYCEAFQSVH